MLANARAVRLRDEHSVISVNSFYAKLRSIDSWAVVCDFLALKSIKYEIGPQRLHSCRSKQKP
jgi:hypothetical protein